MVRSKEQRAADKTKGDKTEFEFQETIAVLGGAATPTGPLEENKVPYPVTACPEHDGNGAAYFVAPDFFISFPNQPTIPVQVKSKKLFRDSKLGEPYFYLDAKQHYLMIRAYRHYGNAVFVVHYTDNDKKSRFIYVDVKDLLEERNQFNKRTINEKPTFLIPLKIFLPLHNLRNHYDGFRQYIPRINEIRRAEYSA